MKRYLALSVCSLGLLFTVGCATRTIEVNLASDQERIPHPSFVANDMTQKHAWPEYSEIKVYKLVQNCQVPQCPLVWNVVVSGEKSPRKIVYGALPSFGSMTIVAPQELQPGQSYALGLDRAENTPATGKGSINFIVNDDGTISSLGN
jgi:hypothetical protein